MNNNNNNNNNKHNEHLDIDSFANATGIVLAYKLSKWVAIGSFMGVSDAIPGYSGGTTLSLLGVFSRLVLMAKSVFKPEKGITRLRALFWMLPFALGWVLGVFSFAKFTEFMVEHHFGLELMFLFGFFILTAIPIFIKGEKPNIGIKKRKVKNNWWGKFVQFFFANERKGIWWRRVTFLFGFSIVLTASLIIYFIKGGEKFDGPPHVNGTYKLPWDIWTLKFVIISYAAGIVTIIPGASGATIQLIGGEYQNIHWKVMAHFYDNFGHLCLFWAATMLGMITSIFALSWLIKNKKAFLTSLSLGMLIASIFAIFIVPETNVWGNIFDTIHIIGIICSSIIGIASGIWISFLINKKINRREKQKQERQKTQAKK